MKIRAFKMTSDKPKTMVSLIDMIHSLPLQDRVRPVGSGEISLKEVDSPRTGGRLLDFTSFRHAGPGKAPRGRRNEDFDLAHDEFFGEETAALFVPNGSDFVVQYNHHGPRISTIEQYLNSFAADLSSQTGTKVSAISIDPIMRSDQLARFQKMTHIKRVSFKMFVPGALQAPQARRKSVSGIFDNSVVPSSETVSVEISAGRSKQLQLGGVKSLVSDLLGLSEDVTKLVVTGSDDKDEQAAALDLLRAQLQTERTILSTSRKRHAIEERWLALRSAYDHWKSTGDL